MLDSPRLYVSYGSVELLLGKYGTAANCGGAIPGEQQQQAEDFRSVQREACKKGQHNTFFGVKLLEISGPKKS